MTVHHKIAIALTTLLCGVHYALWLNPGAEQEVVDLQKQVDEVLRQNKAAAQQNAQLQAIVNDLREGGDELSATARTELGMVAKNEIFVNFPRTNSEK